MVLLVIDVYPLAIELFSLIYLSFFLKVLVYYKIYVATYKIPGIKIQQLNYGDY